YPRSEEWLCAHKLYLEPGSDLLFCPTLSCHRLFHRLLLSLIRRIRQRELCLEFPVPLVVCPCHCGRCWDGCDLPDADGAVSHIHAGLFYDDRLHIRRLIRLKESQRAIAGHRIPVLDLILLCERIAKAHDHAALDLPFHADGVDRFSYIVCRNHFFDGPVFVQHTDLCRVSVSHMGYRIRHIASHLVCLSEVFSHIIPA